MSKIAKDFYLQNKIKLPISGGMGQSRDDAIIIHTNNSGDAMSIKYAVIKFIAEMRNEDYKAVRASLEKYNSRMIEHIKIAWASDNKNYYNFYFDITEVDSLNVADDIIQLRV